MPRRPAARLIALGICCGALPGAALARSTTPAAAAAHRPQIEGAYLTTVRIRPSDPRLVLVIIKTKAPLPRRPSGQILFGPRLDNQPSSLRSVKGGTSKRCYSALFGLTQGGKVQGGGTSMRPGTTHAFAISRFGADDAPVTRTLKASAPRKGDAQGKRLGC